MEAFGALLGPERTRAACKGMTVLVSVPGLIWMSYRERWLGLVHHVGLVLGWLFENYTVNASIFVGKILRAHGGCLGIRSR